YVKRKKMSTFVTMKEKTLARCRKMGSTILVLLTFKNYHYVNNEFIDFFPRGFTRRGNGLS
ncbi:hypothetical protein, partial [Porphyromonas levii]|uniref:hypothetical protein n=1 Tax=Porphyromonas levii TaxID=28114 RepID=UPI001BA92185